MKPRSILLVAWLAPLKVAPVSVEPRKSTPTRYSPLEGQLLRLILGVGVHSNGDGSSPDGAEVGYDFTVRVPHDAGGFAD